MTTTALLGTIPVFWITFLVYWIAQARSVKPAAEKQSRSSSLAYRLPLMLCGILLWFPFARFRLGLALTPQTELTAVIGVAVCALGLLVAIWARRTLADNWSSFVTFKQGHELVQTGPYRYVRHPIYTGMLTMCLGTALAGGRICEQHMAPHFGGVAGGGPPPSGHEESAANFSIGAQRVVSLEK